jgi:hypothetical protein
LQRVPTTHKQRRCTFKSQLAFSSKFPGFRSRWITFAEWI